jgi:RNA polymerase sigma factor (sigma-70 family)
METDLEFAQRCTNGDKQAWEEFLIRYSRLIYTYIFSSARSSGIVFTSQEKEDIFQEIILSLIDNNSRKLRSFRSLHGCSLASWLRQVTINFTLGRIARRIPAFSLEQEDRTGLALKDSIADPGRSVTETAQAKEDIHRLTECIELLETGDKYFLELNLGLGLNIEEIREYLKISRGAADMRKSRIVERLRECFKGKGVVLGGR